ncbi:CPXV054 protein, partial [Monkeypox virus]
IESVYF